MTACIRGGAPTTAEYPAPLLELISPPVSPSAAGVVPIDRPVVVFRLVGPSGTDSADARSFRVWVDGQDRSALFHIDGSEAWGALAAGDGPAARLLTPGIHLVSARLCTMRGVCTSVHEPIAAYPATAMPGTGVETPGQNATTTALTIPPEPQHNLLELLWLGVRKLWLP